MTRETEQIIKRMSASELRDMIASRRDLDSEMVSAVRRRLDQLANLTGGEIDGMNNRGDRTLAGIARESFGGQSA
jgi:hypothetical protein